MPSKKEHWDNVYKSKKSEELSWSEELPSVSLSCINEFHLPRAASILDVGGGDSKLVDCLLDEGFEDITVLDISEYAIQRARHRLGGRSSQINWVVGDILDFHPTRSFDCWHDRAAFHFLTDRNQISQYAALAKQYIKPKGYLVIGCFSENGPKKCSGLSVTTYRPETLTYVFSKGFRKLKCITHDHQTPFHTLQNFLFCSFQRI